MQIILTPADWMKMDRNTTAVPLGMFLDLKKELDDYVAKTNLETKKYEDKIKWLHKTNNRLHKSNKRFKTNVDVQTLETNDKFIEV